MRRAEAGIPGWRKQLPQIEIVYWRLMRLSNSGAAYSGPIGRAAANSNATHSSVPSVPLPTFRMSLSGRQNLRCV